MKYVNRAALAALCFWTTAAFAADPAAREAKTAVEEIVVTGSYIQGSAKDAALPVQSITAQDMLDQGSPSIIEMVRDLSVTSGNLGETNQFQGIGQGNEGVTTINLRGLGASRTLVLINGRRQVATETNGVDISAIPTSALGRTEVLLGGAAATYGSDAIAGVVNFITRSNFEGLEIGGSFQSIDNTEGSLGGNPDASLIYGWGNDRLHVMFAFEYDERAKLPVKERDWALQPYDKNPGGGYSAISNPATVYPATTFAAQADPGCAVLGNFTGGACRFQFTYFDNLAEKQTTYKYFTELNYDVSDTSKFHVEALYAKMDMPSWNTSPSYPPQSLFGPDRFIAPTHPGLIDMKLQNPGFVPDVGGVPQGAFAINRYLGVTGFFGKPQTGGRATDTYRLGVSLNGSMFEEAVNYDMGVTWSRRERYLNGKDMFVQNMAFALNGLGGPGCVPGGSDPASSTPGVGPCEYYNPFSNAVERSVVTGIVNPQYNPAVANSPELQRWLIGQQKYDTTSDLLVWDLVFSGETPLTLPGGAVGWAAGFQARNEKYNLSANKNLNLAQYPCPFTDPYAVTLGLTPSLNCAFPTGPFAFLAGTTEENTSRNVYGLFAEFALPILDTLDMQFAVRYEDYGSDVGSTVDPKIALRWQALDWLAFRASATTTFRGPPQSFLGGRGTALVFIAPTNAFKAVDTVGNPKLTSESAVTSNVGFIVNAGGFSATMDYWYYDFKDPFQVTDPNQIVSAYSAQNCYTGAPGAPGPNCAELQTHITPMAVPPAGIERVEVYFINGGKIKTTGIDASAQYDFEDVFGGVLSIGATGTYTIEYDSDDFKDIGGTTVAPGGDFAGLLNTGTPFTSLPDFKGNTYIKYVHGPHRFTYMLRYITDYRDARSTTIAPLRNIDSVAYSDVYYNVSLFNDSTVLSLSVMNLTDEDPPATQSDLNYDPYTADPFGRMFKVGLRYTFGGG